MKRTVYCKVEIEATRRFVLSMVRFSLLFIGLFLFAKANAQLGNEWIRFSQFYYKVPVAEDGLYRITYNDLVQAGFPVGSVDPRRLQLFHRGVEQAIHVEGQEDAQFNPSDYIEFYGRKNDGTTDTELYQPASSQPHLYYNLFSDTTVYFLTHNNQAVLGKRIAKTWEVNVSNLPQEASHHQEKLLVLAQQHSSGRAYSTYIRNTFFDEGEGWTGAVVNQNGSIDYLLEGLTNGVSSEGLPQLEVLVAGRAEIAMPHRAEIYAGPSVSALRLIATEDIFNFSLARINQPLNWTDISAEGRMVVRLRVLATGTSARASVSYLKVIFPQNFNASGETEKYFCLKENSGGKSFINIQNAPANARLFDVTDSNDLKEYVPPASAFNPVISDTDVPRKLYITGMIRPVNGIKKVNFRNITPSQHDYIIISHPLLMKPASGHEDVVKAYAGYRASEEGGSYDTLVVDIHQLYNQFNYGEISPLAIYRFMRYMVNGHVPKYLFIIGKGLDWMHNYHRNPSTFPVYKDLVPSAGMPASDMAFTIGLAGTTYEPAVPTGRISATNPSQVAAYLNKVKEMEALPFKDLWRKHLIHLSGGLTASEVFFFRSYLEGFQSIAESKYLGGKVKAQAKNTTHAGELINISEEVNKGVNLITFFGHSSPETSDFEVGFVSNPALGYNNPGKYPMFLINGCNAADFFSTDLRYGEDWVLAANKGATGFMAHTSFGYTFSLLFYSDFFYRVAFGDSVFIRKGVGDIQKEVARRYLEVHEPTAENLTQVSQMLLLGDPVVNVFGASKPDYAVTDTDIFVQSSDGGPITALSESFTLHMITKNFGRVREDSVHVRVTRIFNDNSSETYDTLYPPVYYRDTLVFTIRQELNKGFGNNTFVVEIDPFDVITELNKENNQATFNLFIPLNITKNLFPYDYAIVSSSSVPLTFSSTDILGQTRDFELEIDTVHTFNSPFLKKFTVNGVIASQSLDLLPQDSLAYYWRTRFKDPQVGEASDWVTSSFTFIDQSAEGWAQVHFPQYLKNESVGLVQDPAVRLLSFVESTVSLDIHTFGADHPAAASEVSVKINNAEYNPDDLGFKCRDNTINLIAFDKQSVIPYTAVEFNPFDGRACGRRPQVINSFTASQVETGFGNDIAQYMLNVPEGDSVVVFSIGDPGIGFWSETVKQKFGGIGISVEQLNSILPGEPFVFFGKKGIAPGAAQLYRTSASPASEQALMVGGSITGRFDSGTMTSTLIGPAQQWQSLVTQAVVSEFPQTDEFGFDVVGVSLSGDQQVLLNHADGPADLSFIDAQEYPYLKLVYRARDAINLTPPQLKKWIVHYTPGAEGVLVFNGPAAEREYDEGETWTGQYGFRNISQKTFPGPLTLRWKTFNHAQRTREQQEVLINAPLPGETTNFNVEVNTLDKAGDNDVEVFVNPRILPEQYYENNALRLNRYLVVRADRFNPVLDVTVDGRHLRNGDYVSPNPSIVLTLWDENPYIKKTDTEGVSLRLTYPGSSFATEISFDREDVQWFPQTDENYFGVEFNPVNLPEGKYVFEAEARDARNNSSGTVAYRIEFEVLYDARIILMAPYPNPSASVVRFDLQISGETPPDLLQIQFLSPTGVLVRTLEKTGLHIGTNQLVWDGKDHWGYDVPSGLYLYRLVISRGGQVLSVGIPPGESFFKGSYGKVMVGR